MGDEPSHFASCRSTELTGSKPLLRSWLGLSVVEGGVVVDGVRFGAMDEMGGR